jgi:transposase
MNWEREGLQMTRMLINYSTTIPGMGYLNSALPLIKIGEVDRFPSGENLCSYAGLVPSVGSSGSHSAYGSNNKAGDLSG